MQVQGLPSVQLLRHAATTAVSVLSMMASYVQVMAALRGTDTTVAVSTSSQEIQLAGHEALLVSLVQVMRSINSQALIWIPPASMLSGCSARWQASCRRFSWQGMRLSCSAWCR